MGSTFRLLVIAFAVLVVGIAQPVVAQQAPGTAAYSQDELDQLLAPIALYPDDLLTQILVASTYPLEVVQAARFVEKNPDLKGVALDDAVAQKNWDASVQSLAAFPQVLAMMSDKLEWTERLGNAFLADQQRVMDTVQSLRRRAETAGSLSSMPQQAVVERNNVIVIEPSQPDVVYVPVYDPLTIYGPWWAPAYPPWFWYPPPIYGYPVIFTGIAFGIGWPIWSNHWGWGHPDWHDHHVVLHPGHNRFWDRPNHPPPPPGQAWEHSPDHRRGVPYADAQTQQRFQPVSPDAVRQRQNYRGYATPPAQRGIGEPARGQTPEARGGAPAATPPRQAGPIADQPQRAPAMSQQQAPVARQPEAPVARQAQPPAVQSQASVVQPQAPVVRQAQPPVAQSQAPVIRQTQPPVAQSPAPVIRQAQPPVAQPQAPAIRQAPVAPAYGAQRSAPSVFDPGLSRSQAQINAQRGMQSLRTMPSPSAPITRAPSAPTMRAPSAPMTRAPSAPARSAPAPAPRGH